MEIPFREEGRKLRGNSKTETIRMVSFKCDFCGERSTTTWPNFKIKKTARCNKCKQKGQAKDLNVNIYNTWSGMKQRCYYTNHVAYKYYGGKGITVCDEWKTDSMKFYEWSITNGWEEGLTLDRINSDGDYEPSNCRWVDRREQSRNRTISARGSTGYQGVREKDGKYIAEVRIILGKFETLEQAVNARKEFYKQDSYNYKKEK